MEIPEIDFKVDPEAAAVIGALTGKADRLEAECEALRALVKALRQQRLELKRKLRASRAKVRELSDSSREDT